MKVKNKIAIAVYLIAVYIAMTFEAEQNAALTPYLVAVLVLSVISVLLMEEDG